jgi:hypothetical protein
MIRQAHCADSTFAFNQLFLPYLHRKYGVDTKSLEWYNSCVL